MRNVKTYQNLSEWHEWYAWYPIEMHIGDGKYLTVWLERIQRRILQGYGGDARFYRNLDGSGFDESPKAPTLS